MGTDTHGSLGSAHNLRYFRVWTLLKPMQLDDFALARGELIEGTVKKLRALAELQRHEIGLGGSLGLDLQAGHLAPLRPTPVLTNEVHRDGHDPWAKL